MYVVTYPYWDESYSMLVKGAPDINTASMTKGATHATQHIQGDSTIKANTMKHPGHGSTFRIMDHMSMEATDYRRIPGIKDQ